MKSKYDLHVHTSVSDGRHTAEEVVDKAEEKGIEVISITDHDMVDGAREVIKNENNVEVIPGIEFSAGIANWAYHILGYFKEIPDIDIDLKGEMAFKREIQMYIGFTGYIGFGNYIWNKEMKKSQKIMDLIDRNEGLSVLAHPNELNLSKRALERLVKKLKGMGLDGIEVYNTKHDRSNVEFYNKIAKEYNLLRTSGTDFHQDFDKLGQNKMDEEMFENFYKKLNKQ